MHWLRAGLLGASNAEGAAAPDDDDDDDAIVCVGGARLGAYSHTWGPVR